MSLFLFIIFPLMSAIVGYGLLKDRVKKPWVGVLVALGIGCVAFALGILFLEFALQSMD